MLTKLFKRETGNGKRETGNWKRETGNSPSVRERSTRQNLFLVKKTLLGGITPFFFIRNTILASASVFFNF